jgi:hypothetical protein
MSMKRTFAIIALIGTASISASAQTDKMAPVGSGEATIYRDAYFSGPAVAIHEAQPNLGLAWPVRSIRVRSGVWELCSRTNFRSPCIRVSADEPNLARSYNFSGTLISMRPMGSLPVVPVEPPLAQRSLRGMGAEFFPAPVQRTGRVPACLTGGATANCAAISADRFCRSAGWNGARSQALQTENRRVYLADVLCANSGI